jgi:hypothetical protein
MDSNRYTEKELTSAYELGENAYHRGFSLEDNPFDESLEGELRHKWDEGFLEAEENDEVTVEEDEDFATTFETDIDPEGK